jgi:hypothetical protein
MPVILATQEAEIRRITFQSQPRQIVCETLSQKNPSQKRAGGVAQGGGREFKPITETKQTKTNLVSPKKKKKKELGGTEPQRHDEYSICRST